MENYSIISESEELGVMISEKMKNTDTNFTTFDYRAAILEYMNRPDKKAMYTHISNMNKLSFEEMAAKSEKAMKSTTSYADHILADLESHGIARSEIPQDIIDELVKLEKVRNCIAVGGNTIYDMHDFVQLVQKLSTFVKSKKDQLIMP